MEEHERIELRSEDVQEIIGTPPRWIVRWGTFVVSAAIVALVSMSFFVKYPDKVQGVVTVTSKVAAVRVNAQQSGQIRKLYVKDGDKVEQSDLLVVMQDAANYQDVDELEEMMGELQNADKSELLEFLPSDFKQFEIGNLQPLYSKVQTDFKDFQFTEQNQAAAKQIKDIQSQMANIKIIRKNLTRSKKDAENKRKLEYNKFLRYRELHNKKDISLEVFEEQQKAYLNAKSDVESIDQQLNDRLLNLSQLSGRITQLRSSSSETNNENYIQLENSINNLVGAIDRWNEQNLLIAAINGKISMVNNWSEKQYIEQSQEILAIIPENMDSSLFIQMFIPIQGSGRVKIGQRVLLKFDNYPYREYGQVDGEVVELPGLPRNNAMPVKIKLTNGLITRSKKVLKFEQEMRGVGEIITEDKTVFARIFENIIQPFREM